MPLILITGAPTSGKSTIAQALISRGYEAYDTEHNDSSAWFDKKTGAKVAAFNEPHDRSEAWYQNHEWLTSLDWVKDLAKQASHSPIFICGESANETDIRAFCQHVIWLKIDEQTIRKRVKHLRDHDYGSKPNELAYTINVSNHGNNTYPSTGAIVIDATQPLEHVINEILEVIAPKQE